MELIIAVCAVIFLSAWWNLFRQMASGGRWVKAASFLNLALSIVLPLYDLRWGGVSDWTKEIVFLVPMTFGIAGLFAFPRKRFAAKVAGTA
jgi:hypothetical protein